MDLNKSLRLAIDTGKVSVGSKQSCKAINSGSAKLVILASNCPKETTDIASQRAKHLMLCPLTTRESSVGASTVPLNLPWVESYLSR